MAGAPPAVKRSTGVPRAIAVGRTSVSESSSGARRLSQSTARSGRRNVGPRAGKRNDKAVKVAAKGIDVISLLPPPVAMSVSVPEKQRCAWITPNSEPLYVLFHDEEWGVPVQNDDELFELLILSQLLSELSWPTILSNRGFFRNLFDDYEIQAIAKFNEKKILSLKARASTLISEQKLRIVVENARQMLKVIEEFGAFSYYCWRFVSHKPIVNGYRYARQVPIKTPKSEVISKDLMRRGFRCVGPTIVYSFMQAAGLVNDHLAGCFRYQDCRFPPTKDCKRSIETTTLGIPMDKACFSLQA